MLKLYYTPRTRCGRTRWTLEELGVPYQIVPVDLEKGEHLQPDYRLINPMAVVPALVDDDQVILESVATCLYLADKFPEGLLGPSPENRGKYYQWCLFLASTLDPPSVDYFFYSSRLPEAERIASVTERARRSIDKALAFLDASLGNGAFLVGERFSVADILIGGTLGWLSSMKLMNDYPKLQAYAQALRVRPAFQRAQA